MITKINISVSLALLVALISLCNANNEVEKYEMQQVEYLQEMLNIKKEVVKMCDEALTFVENKKTELLAVIDDCNYNLGLLREFYGLNKRKTKNSKQKKLRLRIWLAHKKMSKNCQMSIRFYKAQLKEKQEGFKICLIEEQGVFAMRNARLIEIEGIFLRLEELS